MDKKEFKKMWQKFLIDTENTNAAIAEVEGCTPQTLGRKINDGTIRLLEAASIFEKYGYRLELVKDEKK